MIKISSENIHGFPFKVLKCWVKIPYLLDFYAHFKQFITFITQYHLMTLIIIDIIITSVFIGYQYHIIIDTWPFISYQYHLEVGRIYHIEFFIEKLCEKLSYRFCYQIWHYHSYHIISFGKFPYRTTLPGTQPRKHLIW